MSLVRTVVGWLGRGSDLVLAALVALMVGVMILRVTPGIMDVLIALNLSGSVVLLMVALYAAEGARLPSFPTILLLTTLFRLALNVSSTRLILLEGNAGDIITAFGQFVVGGNYAVGAVVFVVLTIVQFLVIAKGAERVSEVGARFALDAMPGKQMSIDADLRSGFLKESEARARRDALERESKLYGAMDGAMKFVKGDAIAGILISIVNILGGLAVGMLQNGLDLGEAAQVYALLTIGDGLVAQIPALLVSVSAGLVVTRVAGASRTQSGRLAGDMIEQLLENPRALMVAGSLLLMVGATSGLSGFPPLPFVALGGLVLGSGLLRARADGRAAAPANRDSAGKTAGPPEPARPDGAPPRVTIDVHPELFESLQWKSSEQQQQAVRNFRALSDGMRRRLGIPVPLPLISPLSTLRPGGYRIAIDGGVVAQAQLVAGKRFVAADAAVVTALGIEAVPMLEPGTRLPMVMIGEADMDKVRGAGLAPLSSAEVLLRHLERTLTRHAHELLGVQETADLLDELQQRQSELVDAVVPGKLSMAGLTELLRDLLREQVSIRHLPRILGAVAAWAHEDPRVGTALMRVRAELARSLCTDLCDREFLLRCYTLAPEVEDWLRTALSGAASTPDEENELRVLVAAAVDPSRHRSGRPALVVEAEMRERIARVLAPTLPEVAVLAYGEVPPEIQWDKVARIERVPRAA